MISQLLEFIDKELNEGLKSARRTYLDSDKIDQAEFDWCVSADPTSQKKYLDWICKQYITHDELDLEGFKTLIKDFYTYSEDKLIDNPDIYTYKTIEQVADAITAAKSKVTKKKKKESAIKGAAVSFETDKYVGYNIYSNEASKKYGAGAPWCTRSEESPSHWFDYRYNDRKSFIYILNKIKPKDKYALVYIDNKIHECWDIINDNIGFSQAFDNMQKVDDSITDSYIELFKEGIPESGELRDPKETIDNEYDFLTSKVKRITDKLFLQLSGVKSRYLLKDHEMYMIDLNKNMSSEKLAQNIVSQLIASVKDDTSNTLRWSRWLNDDSINNIQIDDSLINIIESFGGIHRLKTLEEADKFLENIIRKVTTEINHDDIRNVKLWLDLLGDILMKGFVGVCYYKTKAPHPKGAAYYPVRTSDYTKADSFVGEIKDNPKWAQEEFEYFLDAVMNKYKMFEL